MTTTLFARRPSPADSTLNRDMGIQAKTPGPTEFERIAHKLGTLVVEQLKPVEENKEKFLTATCKTLEPMVLHAFSRAANFVQYGMSFSIDDLALRGQPVEWLAKIAQEYGIQLASSALPYGYTVYVTLDEQLSKLKQELVFTLAQKREGISFSKENFTLSELA